MGRKKPLIYIDINRKARLKVANTIPAPNADPIMEYIIVWSGAMSGTKTFSFFRHLLYIDLLFCQPNLVYP